MYQGLKSIINQYLTITHRPIGTILKSNRKPVSARDSACEYTRVCVIAIAFVVDDIREGDVVGDQPERFGGKRRRS